MLKPGVFFYKYHKETLSCFLQIHQIFRPEVRKNILNRASAKVEEKSSKEAVEKISPEEDKEAPKPAEEAEGLTIILPTPPEEADSAQQPEVATTEPATVLTVAEKPRSPIPMEDDRSVGEEVEEEVVEVVEVVEEEEEAEAVQEDPELAPLITTLKVGKKKSKMFVDIFACY